MPNDLRARIANQVNWHISLSLVMVLFLPDRALAVEEKAMLRSQLYEEAPKAWQRYLEAQPETFVVITQSESDTPGARYQSVRIQTTWKRVGLCYLKLGVYESLTGLTYAEAWGQNPHYSFRLRRTPASNHWIVEEIHREPDSQLLASFQRLFERPLTLWNLRLPQLLQDPDFQLEELDWAEHQSRKLVRLSFSYEKAPEHYPFPGGHRLRGGWALLDPQRDWLLVAYAVYTLERGKKYWFRHRFDWQRVIYPLGLPAYSEIEESVFGQTRITYDFQDIVPPLSDFSLRAFGLPEPAGVIWPQPTPWWLYLSLTGLGLVVIGLALGTYLRWRRARLAQMSAN